MITPTAQKGGATYQALSPKINQRASASWLAFEANAPATLIPTKDAPRGKAFLRASMTSAEETVPTAEKAKTYEKRVPPISP